MTRRIAVCAALSYLLAAWLAPADGSAAKVPVCGDKNADGNTVLGSLALNDNSSAIKSYGTGKGDRQLVLLYSVSGCTLPPGTAIAPEQVSLLPAKTGADLPGKPAVAVTVDDAGPTDVAASVALKLDDIDPGTHAGIVRIHAPQFLQDSFTPISESRTDLWLWPVLLGLLGAVAGGLWAVALHLADTVDLKFSLKQAVLVGVLTIGAGLVAGFGYWHNQDVWTMGDNGWETLIAGFTASTAGALAGVTTALISPKTASKVEGQGAPATAQPQPPPSS
jgi:hypothetical protein